MNTSSKRLHNFSYLWFQGLIFLGKRIRPDFHSCQNKIWNKFVCGKNLYGIIKQKKIISSYYGLNVNLFSNQSIFIFLSPLHLTPTLEVTKSCYLIILHKSKSISRTINMVRVASLVSVGQNSLQCFFFFCTKINFLRKWE